jgi:hypothetical protein
MPTIQTLLQPSIPTIPKAFGWILVLAGSFFAYIYMFSPGTFFPGVTISTYSEQFGLYSTGVRISAAVLGIIIALYFNSAALLALMLVTRVFTEAGDVVVGLVVNRGVPDTNTFTLLVLAAVEVFMITLLLKVLRKAMAA